MTNSIYYLLLAASGSSYHSKQKSVEALVKEYCEKANIRLPLVFEKSFEEERKKSGK